jgi:hypothetical protein
VLHPNTLLSSVLRGGTPDLVIGVYSGWHMFEEKREAAIAAAVLPIPKALAA